MKRRRRLSDLPRGIRRTSTGYEANVGVNGRTKWKRFRFPPGTDQAQAILSIEAWRALKKSQAAKKPSTTDDEETITLGGAIAVYLPARAAMPSYRDRVRELADWVHVFGSDYLRERITRVKIQTQRDKWVLEGKSASWINHRLYAMANLFTVLDGRHAPNPAREVADVDQPDPEPRGLPYDLIEAILSSMPDRGQGLKDVDRSDQSKTKARLAVIAYTGLAHVQLKRLEPGDVNWTAGSVFVRSRKKGKQGRPKGRVKPLTPEGLAALKRFAELKCWGGFSNSSMRTSFHRACAILNKDKKRRKRWARFGINLLELTPYDFRHSYATAVLAGTGSLKETQELMAHADERTTMRYALAAVPKHLAAALRRASPFMRGDGRTK